MVESIAKFEGTEHRKTSIHVRAAHTVPTKGEWTDIVRSNIHGAYIFMIV